MQTLHAKATMPDSQRYLFNICLINNVPDIAVFLGKTEIFVEKSQLKIISFKIIYN